MLVVVFFLNLLISVLNAWAVGRSWTETRLAGGMPRFMSWMGATMAAVGFTWCYLVVAVIVASTPETGGLTPEQVQVVAELGYLVIIGPLLGSGLAITLESWARFWRERSFGNGVTAAWNTYAQLSNMADAARVVPGMWKHVSEYFEGDSDERGQQLVLALVFCVAFAGVLTAALIIRTVASRREFELATRLQATRGRR